MFGGGVVYGIGYPTTLGAFQITFNGGAVDIGISKFNSTGTNLIYSTYLGGANNDYPHSLIVNHNNELLILGTTRSINFPVKAGNYDTTQNGSSDIFVAKLNTNGNVLLGSTFIGGVADDGLNWGNPLRYNYADQYRGEIIVDQNDFVFVASTTQSFNFPTTPGVFQYGNIVGETNQNACVFKLSPNLTTLVWSSYFGGTMDDAGYSLQFDELGNILFTGGTKSADLPVSATAINTTKGGVMDGYITKITPNASTILACTYIGTDSLDQTFFVQLDTANNVYVYGQTEGNYPITPVGVYADSNSGQFLHKLTPNLDSTIFSTAFGTSSGHVDIAPSAFLVNSCNNILISGWGGKLDRDYGAADYSTTIGMPVTANAQQPNTDGQDYYLAMFGENAASLIYATFFGGTSSADHVDGGTSRFDKKGMVYQAVCSSCDYNSPSFPVQNTTDFPTTPGAWSNTNNSSNCNLGVFKLDLTNLTAIADIVSPNLCLGETAQFINHSVGGITFLWHFGDGNSSSNFEPSYVFDSVGTYHVTLFVLDSTSCNIIDSDFVDVFIAPLPHFSADTISGICIGDSIQLQVIGANTYQWLTTTNISDSTISNPYVWPVASMNYSVYVTSDCGNDTISIFVEVFYPNNYVLPDITICRGHSTVLGASGGSFYLWTPNTTLNIDTIPNPTATPYNTTTYTVKITDANLCISDTFMTVFVDTILAKAIVSNDTTICAGDSIKLSVTGGDSYLWSPPSLLNNPNDSIPIVFPNQTTYFIVKSSKVCNTVEDSVLVNVLHVNAQIVDDTLVCVGETANLWVTGGQSYWWEPSQLVSNPANNVVQTIVFFPSLFTVTVTDSVNCSLNLNVYVDTLPYPTLELEDHISTAWGSEIILTPVTNGYSYQWFPSNGLSCTTCLNPTVTAISSSEYSLTASSQQGCKTTKTITINFDGILHVPNSFTPNGDGVNDIFYAYGKEIVEFEMMIFDRWGEKLFTSNNLDKGWDGYYKGDLSKTETYVWKINYKDIQRNVEHLIGTVTLLR